jgi:hypothetical protein
MAATGALLLAEDCDLAARAAKRALRDVTGKVEIIRASTKGEALELVGGREDWRAFVVDIRLGVDPYAGLDILESALRRAPHVPRAGFTGLFDPFVVNRVAALHGTLLLKNGAKPLDALAIFVAHALAAPTAIVDHGARTDAYAKRRQLTPRMHDILSWRVAGRTAEEYQHAKNIKDTTYRRHIVRLLAKTKGDFKRGTDLVAYLLREA